MATMLLIGTNAWANVHPIQDEDDEAKVQINGGEWQYATKLKEAFDAVQPGQTAEIVLLNPVTLDDHITMPATINSTVLAGTCQTITLNLNGRNITAPKAVTPFRLVKGTLNITGSGTISKSEVGGGEVAYEGGSVIGVWGAESPSAANWSNLTIGKDVIISIKPEKYLDGTTYKCKGVGIMIQDHDGVARIANHDDPMYCTDANITTKYGYRTYYYNASIVSGETWITEENKSTYMTAGNGVPMKCGALANFKNNDSSTGESRGIQQGSAFGVNVIIEGTVIAGKRALQLVGHINQKPVCTEDDHITKRDTTRYKVAPYNQYKYPYIKIASTANVHSSDCGGANGIYAAGYGVFDIAGEVYGATGIYMKAGDVDLQDAYIHSNSTVNTPSNGGTSGVNNAGGSAIAIESNDAYAGGSGLSITGDTKVEGNGGFAIFEETYKADNTATTSHVSIEGGTIQGGDAGAIAITVDSKNDNVVTVSGGTVSTTGTTPAITVGENTIEVPELFPNTNYHTTEVEVDGKTVIVVSQGGAPETQEGDEPTPWSWCAHNDQSGKNVAWTKIEDAEIASGTITLGELQIVSGTGESLGERQQLTIKSGATLQVNHLIMNDYARIIVKAGGKLIVKGKQGIVAPQVENIKLEASETAQALFLLHPEVSSNRHPNATVEFISNSITNNPFFSKQRFGIPTWKKLSSITTKNGGNNVQTAIASFSFEANDWIDVSWINIDGKDENLNLIANPFEYYQMQHNTPNAGTVVTMTGELYGNTNPTLPILGNSWNGYANSYMAPINGQILIELIPDEVDKSFQIYELVNGAKGHWVPVSNLALADINPMQAFLIGNTKEAANVTVDYWDAVYTPITHEAKPAPNAAPVRRSTLSNITKAKMIVRGEGYKDGVVLAQDDQFSAAFDNSYDCRKYMNEGINLYVSADEKMGIYATDNLENTYVGFQSVNGGTYTIEFTDVQGEELTLIDHETGAQVAMVEGNTYAFTAAANATNDYRFEVVGAAKMPTAIENAEAVKNAKGIYTITGQYLGEMNVWNSLPAGVYVVNGEKRVK